MSNIDKQALREAAEKAGTDNHTQDEWFHYLRCSTPATVLALLDEIAELEQGHCGTALLEREEMHAKTLGRMLDELEAKDRRIAELEAREVKLPELKMLRDYLAEITMREREDILVGVRLEFFRALEEAGVKVAAAGKGE
ncbi:ead/Ea22-like family protein [Enterobacter sichuanensis]|uniref:ead/Ea22-like family protein n=1 Tax=Enterobacter sichuanensis TaxID=2071710 RepID=UPI00217E98EF|nr:ead/Ea22-like family protein [Enterobacter sichuanensis]